MSLPRRALGRAMIQGTKNKAWRLLAVHRSRNPSEYPSCRRIRKHRESVAFRAASGDLSGSAHRVPGRAYASFPCHRYSRPGAPGRPNYQHRSEFCFSPPTRVKLNARMLGPPSPVGRTKGSLFGPHWHSQNRPRTSG